MGREGAEEFKFAFFNQVVYHSLSDLSPYVIVLGDVLD